MNIKDFLSSVCNEIKYKPARVPIYEELDAHIQEVKSNYMDNDGLEEAEAEEQAVKQMGEPEEIGKKLNKIHRPKLDWKLLILIAIMILYGLLISILKYEDGSTTIQKNLIFMVLGLAIGIIVYFCDYKKIKKYSNCIYLAAIAIILLTIIPGLGAQVNGSSAYIKIGNSETINVSTISMPLFIIAFVGFVANYNEGKGNKIMRVLKPILCGLFSLGLIVQIQAIANAAILGIVYLIIATVYILRTRENGKKILSIMYGTIASLTIIMVLVTGIGSEIIERLEASLNPVSDSQGVGYTSMLQEEILEKAELVGEANTKIITTSNYTISKDNNFDFIYLVGKVGIIMGIALVAVIVLASIKLMLNAKLTRNMYGKLLIIGLSSLYILQFAINILMNINLGIETNVNLPFVSDQGIYFVINSVCLAVILSIYRKKNIDNCEKIAA